MGTSTATRPLLEGGPDKGSARPAAARWRGFALLGFLSVALVVAGGAWFGGHEPQSTSVLATNRGQGVVKSADKGDGGDGDGLIAEQRYAKWDPLRSIMSRHHINTTSSTDEAQSQSQSQSSQSQSQQSQSQSQSQSSGSGSGSGSSSSMRSGLKSGAFPYQPSNGKLHRPLPSDPEYGPPIERPGYNRPVFEPERTSSLPRPRSSANGSEACTWDAYRLPRDMLPVSYNLTIELSSLQPLSIVYGEVHIGLHRNMSLPPARCLALHVSPEMNVSSILVCDHEQGCEDAVVAKYDREWAQLQVETGRPLSHGASLRIAFSYVLRDKLTGLYHSRFTGVDGAEHSIATTQHEATSASETFPCWDEPGFKATFRLTLHVPASPGTVALANMPALSSRELEVSDTLDESLRGGRPVVDAEWKGAEPALPGLRRIDFDVSPRMSTYLVAFTIGEFESISSRSRTGVELRAWAPAATQQLPKLAYALKVAVEALDHYEAMFRVPFPLPKIDIVAIPDFGPGAMENWGLITYRATNVLADEASAPRDKQSVACTVVHEMAHQWTGNLVTMQWWDELWLNEGFANYFEQAVTSLIEPDLMILKQHVQYLSRALHFDGSPDTHPVRAEKEINSDSDVASLFDAITYDKAGAVIFMLHDYLERKAPGKFVEAIQSYLTDNQFGSASGADMWAHLGRASGLPISEWVEPWFSQAGYPLIEVTTLSDGSAVLLQTGRFLQDLTRQQMAFMGQAGGDQAAYTDSWWVPISYYTSDSPDVQVGEIVSSSSFFSIPPARKRLGGFDVNGVDWLKVNFNGAGFYRVNYAPHLWARLVQAASEPSRLSDADLANLIDDAFALTLDGRLSGVTLSLARALGIRTAHERSFVTQSYESWQSLSIGLHLFLTLISGAALSGASGGPGVIAGPGLALIPRRCVEDLQRFVRTQVLGRALDAMLAVPPTGVPTGSHGAKASADEGAQARAGGSNQLEALSPPVLLSLASTMGDVRVGMWVTHALEACMENPTEQCKQIGAITPDLRFPCLAICTAFDVSGRCWRLMLEQMRFADNEPAYRSALLAALAHAPTEELLNATIALTVNSSVVRPQDIGSMIAMLANNARLPRARHIVWEFAKANVLTMSMGGGGGGSFGFSNALSNVASGFATEEMAQDVQIFLAVHPNLNVPERIERAVVGRIRSQAMWVEVYGADTCAVLESWHA